MNAKSAILSANRFSNTIKFSKTLDNASKSARIHKTAPVTYPEAKTIPLPNNIEGIFANEIGRFSPQRVRDINGPVMISQTAHKAVPLFLIQRTETSYDPRVASYDCQSAVNLNSSMQTNVPKPFCSRGKATHFNMPGGQWESNNKFISEDMRKAHYINSFNKKKEGIREYCTFTKHFTPSVILLSRLKSTNSGDGASSGDQASLTRTQRLKKAVTEYGSTVIVFHVGISLISLGTCYLLISSGVDITKIFTLVGLEEKIISSKLATNTGTFVAAYAVHKLFAPVRISITLGATPFIVRYLRNIGFLKQPKKV